VSPAAFDRKKFRSFLSLQIFRNTYIIKIELQEGILMATQLSQNPEPYMPDEKEIELARTSSRILSALASKQDRSIEISLKVEGHRNHFAN
jgi:hypothetical protein